MSGGILRCYIPEVSSEADPDTQRPSVLICPGGAYVFCSNREAEPIALYYLSKGYNAFVLFYSVAPAKYPEPQVQAMAAIELIRKTAAYGIAATRYAAWAFPPGAPGCLHRQCRHGACAQLRSHRCAPLMPVFFAIP